MKMPLYQCLITVVCVSRKEKSTFFNSLFAPFLRNVAKTPDSGNKLVYVVTDTVQIPLQVSGHTPSLGEHLTAALFLSHSKPVEDKTKHQF